MGNKGGRIAAFPGVRLLAAGYKGPAPGVKLLAAEIRLLAPRYGLRAAGCRLLESSYWGLLSHLPPQNKRSYRHKKHGRIDHAG